MKGRLLATREGWETIWPASFERARTVTEKQYPHTTELQAMPNRETAAAHEKPLRTGVLAQRRQTGHTRHPPIRPLTQEEFDAVQELPYARRWHPSYDQSGGIPALAEVQFSITSNRGCFGSCSFCAITSHQGRMITNRSIASLQHETKEITSLANFKGYIHDVGGPTANFQGHC